MKRFKKLSMLLTAALLTFGVAACNKDNADKETPAASTTRGATETVSQPPAEPNDKILVIGADGAFEERWNPFIVENAYDHMVVDQIFTPICQLDKNNELVDYGGSVKTEKTSDGGVLATVTVKEGMRFSDGVPVTIDDYIYRLYVCGDPSYPAIMPGNLLASHIEGVKEYFYDDPDYSARIAEIEQTIAEKYMSSAISFEDFLVYAKETDLDGWWDGDPAGEAGGGATWIDYIKDEGFEADLADIDETNADAVFELLAKVEYTNYIEYYDTAEWYTGKLESDYALGNLAGGIHVPEISGITRIDDYTCTVKFTQMDITADRALTTRNGQGFLIPRHYYGEYEKGNVSKILANMEPMGSGPYIWGGFADNIATCTANMDFFLGQPKTGTVRWQYVPTVDHLEAIASGRVDIIRPVGTKSNVAELNKLGIQYDLFDNDGYGYMGVNCERVSLDVRRGIFTLMNREPAIEAYYGEIAQVIQRPMTTVLAEYPQGASVYYPYSKEKALEFFNAAGYTQQNGKLVDTNGNQLVVNAYVGGEGQGQHPAYAIFVQAANDLAELGGELQIQDVNFNVLLAAMNDGTADIWAMAWGSSSDCDRTSQFHSNGSQNRYRFKDSKMDKLLENIMATLDLNERRALVSEMLDYAMDQAIELPLYQRKNILAYYQDNLNMDTIPTASTFYDYQSEVWRIEVQ